MTAAQRILVVDDDAHIREVVSFALQQAGYQTTEAANGALALTAAEQQPFDAIVLDILMPEMNGTDMCRRLREGDSPARHTPILFLTSKTDEIDRILGLELGGDDYMEKPFSPRELVARLRAILRRIEQVQQRAIADLDQQQQAPQQRLSCGPLELDLSDYCAHCNDQRIPLTATEFGILKTLLGAPGKVYSRDELMDGAYQTHRVVSDRTIDSHVRRVRQKLAAAGYDPIHTAHGIGYQVLATSSST